MKFIIRSLFAAQIAIIVIPLLQCNAWCQANLGSIRGEVKDVRYAVVPGAHLTLTNTATGVVVTSVAGPTGQFIFANLSPGIYTLSTTAAGFKTTVQQNIVVGVGQTVPLDAVLELGQVVQRVTVNAYGAELQTQTSDIGTEISPEEMKDLPVSMSGDMRNPLNFVVLTPGVSGSEPGAEPDYRLNVSGSPAYGNEVYIDGVPQMNTTEPGNISNNHPPIGAISQFKLITSNETAEYGLAEGIVSFAFKSGTNAYHGSAFDYLQNSALDAAGFIADYEHEPKPPLKQNEYGGTFGGPVRIPWLYNGRDKTFFFVDYTGFSYRPSGYNSTLTTFPTEFAQGNFSQALGAQAADSNGNPLYDPAGNPVFTGEIYNPKATSHVTGPDGNSYEIRAPFGPPSNPTNIISAGTTGLSAVSQSVLKYFPHADNDALESNYTRLDTSSINEYRMVAKIDEHINEKNSLSGSVFVGDILNDNNGTLTLYDASDSTAHNLDIRLQHNYIHSPAVMNNLNLGYIRDTGFTGPVVAGPSPGPGFGIAGLPSFPAGSPLAGFAISTVENELGGAVASGDTEGRFYIGDNVTILHGRHSFMLGGEARYLQRGEYGLPNGGFTFETLETALNGTCFTAAKVAESCPASTGNAAASFLFGAVNYVNITYPGTPSYRWHQYGLYLQDDWRLTQNLTLNLGLRYDLQIPRSEAHGNVSTMDPTLPNPSAGDLPGAFLFYGHGVNSLGQPRAGTDRIGRIDYNGLQPRVGFAWNPGFARGTVLRGGAALIRPIGNDNNEDDISGAQYTTGFSNLAMLDEPGDAVGDPAYYWDNSFPASGVAGLALNPGTLVGDDDEPLIHPKSGIPPIQFYWTMEVEHKLSPNTIARVGYVGMHTYDVGIWAKPNEVYYPAAISYYTPYAQKAGMPLNQWLELPITDPRVAASGLNPPWSGFQSVMGSADTAAQALRPDPQYGDTDNPLDPIASVSYNGLLTSLQHYFSHGLTALVSYTFSKTIGDVDSNSGPSAAAQNAIYSGGYQQDFYNQRAERSVTSSDVPHVLSLSYTYELPIGPNKRWLSRQGVVGKITGGWSVSGIQQYQSGRPIHIEYDALPGVNNPWFAGGDGYAFRVNVVPGQPLKNPAYRKSCSGPAPSTAGRSPCEFWINPAAFTAPAPATFGDAPNFFSALRMPWFLDEDLSISKRTQIHQNLSLQFQTNFFNAFNRTVFSNGGDAENFIFNDAPANLSAAQLQNSSTVFGLMDAQQNGARIIQFGMNLEF